MEHALSRALFFALSLGRRKIPRMRTLLHLGSALGQQPAAPALGLSTTSHSSINTPEQLATSMDEKPRTPEVGIAHDFSTRHTTSITPATLGASIMPWTELAHIPAGRSTQSVRCTARKARLRL